MQKFIYSLGLIAIGLIVGQCIRYLVNKGILKDPLLVNKYIKNTQMATLLAIIPFTNIAALWIARFTDLRIIILPLLCVIQMVTGGILGLAEAKVLKLDRKKSGSMFICGSFSNLTSFGGLICFVFFGEMSYAFVSMYIMLEQITQYCYGFPIAKLYGDEEKRDKQGFKSIVKIFLDPYILVYFCCTAVGVMLNMSGLKRPDIFSDINGFLIPFSSFLLIVTVGFRMRFSAVSNYIRECFAIGAIKFLIAPVVITTVAYLLGLGEIENGVPLKVVMIMSSMPPAFTALIPPQLYGLDVDLANSTWLFNTGALVVVLPVIYAVQTFLF